MSAETRGHPDVPRFFVTSRIDFKTTGSSLRIYRDGRVLSVLVLIRARDRKAPADACELKFSSANYFAGKIHFFLTAMS